MNKFIINDFNELYYGKNIHFNNSHLNNNDINVLIHKDRVGFYVLKQNTKKSYTLYVYGNINDKFIYDLKGLFSFNIGEISLKIDKIYNKYVYITTNKNLIINDFLMYIPNYYAENGFLFGPYLDNLLSMYAVNNVSRKISLYQSIDEELSLSYSFIPEKDNILVLDTICQEYIEEELDLDIIYNITETNFSKNMKKLPFKGLKNINMNLKFKIEIDMVKSSNKYCLLCPIVNGHAPTSHVKLSTIQLFIDTVNLLINSI